MKALTQKIALRLRQGGCTAAVCAKQVLEGGLLRSLAPNFVRLAQLAIFVLLWRGFAAAGADLGGFTEGQLLTYTLLSFVVRPQLDILTPATSMLWEGSVVGRYTRPMPVYISYITETIGRWWIPYFFFYGLPALVLAPLFGISPLPASAARGGLFALSLLLAIAVGYALDLIFAALAMRMKNAVWMATRIREAVFNLLSGALIPYALFPAPVAAVLSLSPFGAIASAPLGIYVGSGSPGQLLALQAAWTAVLWPSAHLFYKKSEERMVSYGG